MYLDDEKVYSQDEMPERCDYMSVMRITMVPPVAASASQLILSSGRSSRSCPVTKVTMRAVQFARDRVGGEVVHIGNLDPNVGLPRIRRYAANILRDLEEAGVTPTMYLLDEPESGVDLESIEKVGKMIHDLITGGITCAGRREREGKSALVITHTGQILDYIEADRGYVLCNGTISCAGNPRELLREIRAKGYEECVKCRLVRMS